MTALTDNPPFLPRLEPEVEPVPNEARVEFMFSVLEGLPPARQKRLVMQARDGNVRFLTDGEAERIMSALGLREV